MCILSPTLLGGKVAFWVLWAINKEAVGSHNWEMINLSFLIPSALSEDGQVAGVEAASIIFDIAKVNSARNSREAKLCSEST